MSKEPIRYPYDKWFKRKSCRIVRGKDYFCQPHSMNALLRNAATRRGLRISVEIDEKIITITNHGKKKRQRKK